MSTTYADLCEQLGKDEVPVEPGIFWRRNSRSGKHYSVRYKLPSGKGTRKAFRTLKEARAFRISTKASVLAGSFIDPKRREISMDEWLDEFIARKVWRRRSRENNLYDIDGHIRPAFGRRWIGAIEQGDVQAWVNHLAARGNRRTGKGLAPRTVRNIYDVLHCVMELAVTDNRLPRNPCHSIEFPAIVNEEGVEDAPLEVLTDVQVLTIARRMLPEYELFVWLGAEVGLRLGEILGLTVDRIDFSAGTLRIDRQLTKHREFGPVKTKTSYRTLTPHPALMDRIGAHIAAHDTSPAGTLFRNRFGGMAGHDVLRPKWDRAVQGLGLPANLARPHALRHHFASVLIAERVEIKAIMRVMGHATVQETMDTYGHLFPGAAENAIAAAFANRQRPALRVVGGEG